jgi:hypothetical protein
MQVFNMLAFQGSWLMDSLDAVIQRSRPWDRCYMSIVWGAGHGRIAVAQERYPSYSPDMVDR